MRKILSALHTYWIKDVSFITLLIILLFTVFVLPVIIEHNEQTGLVLLTISLLVMYFVGIWSTTNSMLFLISIGLFSLHLLFKIFEWTGVTFQLYTIDRITVLLNTLVFIVINLKLLFRDSDFNFERVIGAVNVYLLIALSGAFSFDIIYLFYGSSIEGNVSVGQEFSDYVSYIYFSLVCLTTVGFGDIYPANMPARMLSVFLSALGILYPAIIIAKLVSTSTASQVESKGDKPIKR